MYITSYVHTLIYILPHMYITSYVHPIFSYSQLLAVLGEQFIVGNEICGVVISVRPIEDIIAIWNRTAEDNFITSRIRY